MSNMAGVLQEAGTAYPLRTLELAAGYWWDRDDHFQERMQDFKSGGRT